MKTLSLFLVLPLAACAPDGGVIDTIDGPVIRRVAVPGPERPDRAELLALFPAPFKADETVATAWDYGWTPAGNPLPRELLAAFPEGFRFGHSVGTGANGPYVVIGWADRDWRPLDEREAYGAASGPVSNGPEVAVLLPSGPPTFPLASALARHRLIKGRYGTLRQLDREPRSGESIRLRTRTGPYREAFVVTLAAGDVEASRTLGTGPWGTLRLVGLAEARRRDREISQAKRVRPVATVELTPPPGGAAGFVRLNETWSSPGDLASVPRFTAAVVPGRDGKVAPIRVFVAPATERAVTVATAPAFRRPPTPADPSVDLGPVRLESFRASVAGKAIGLDLGEFAPDGSYLGGENHTAAGPTPIGPPPIGFVDGVNLSFDLRSDAGIPPGEVETCVTEAGTSDDACQWNPVMPLIDDRRYAGGFARKGVREVDLRVRRVSERDWRPLGEIVPPPVPAIIPPDSPYHQDLHLFTDGRIGFDNGPTAKFRFRPGDEMRVRARLKDGRIVETGRLGTSYVNDRLRSHHVQNAVWTNGADGKEIPYLGTNVSRTSPRDVRAFLVESRSPTVKKLRLTLPRLPE